MPVSENTPNLNYDEFCDLLGGASCEGNLFLHRKESPLFPLEVFWLKLNLYTTLCKKVVGYHQTLRQPHLALQPTQIPVFLPTSLSDTTPIGWLFQLQLPEEKAVPFVPPNKPDSVQQGETAVAGPPAVAGPLFALPQGIDLQIEYLAPTLQGRPLGHEEKGRAMIRSLEKIREESTGENGARGILEIHFISDFLRSDDYSDKDLFFVSLPISEKETISFWAKKSATQERGLLVTGVTPSLSSSQWDQVDAVKTRVLPNAAVSIYKSYHVPCDLFSLGMILFRTLLVHDKRNIEQVSQAVLRISGSLRETIRDLDGKSPLIFKRIVPVLQQAGFSSDSFLFCHESRGKKVLPEWLWDSVLILALRMVTTVHGFSFCSHTGDYDPDHPYRLMETVLAELLPLLEGIRIELFDAHQRNREIVQACHLFRKEADTKG